MLAVDPVNGTAFGADQNNDAALWALGKDEFPLLTIQTATFAHMPCWMINLHFFASPLAISTLTFFQSLKELNAELCASLWLVI